MKLFLVLCIVSNVGNVLAVLNAIGQQGQRSPSYQPPPRALGALANNLIMGLWAAWLLFHP